MTKQNDLNKMKYDFALLNSDDIVMNSIIKDNFDIPILTDNNGYMDNSKKLLNKLINFRSS